MFITVDLFNFVDIRIEIYSLTFEFVVLEVTHCLLLFIICNPCRTKFRGFMIPYIIYSASKERGWVFSFQTLHS